MTDSQKFLLEILADHLNNRPTLDMDNICWEEVISYAKIHQVMGIVYHQCKKFLPKDYYDKLNSQYFTEYFLYYNRVECYKILSEKFNDNKIAFFTVKGLEVAKHYPVPSLRTMGDCDIVVSDKDRKSAGDIFSELGYEDKSVSKAHEWTYKKNSIYFELHDSLLYDEPVTIKKHKLFFDSCWAVLKNGELDSSFHFLYLLIHLRKHLINYGVGLRQFMDLAVEIKYNNELDWNYIEDKLKELEITDFAKKCFGLIKQWFDISAPIVFQEADYAFYDLATIRIFSNGVFGYDNKENLLNKSIISLSNNSGMSGRLKILLSKVFPSYNNMRYVKSYKFVDGKPYLLPIAWLYRFYRSVSCRMVDNGKRILDDVTVSNHDIINRKKELSEWGIKL